MAHGSIYVDEGYRTALGTGFYDRLEELDRLAELLGAVRTLVVYGPRNVGKSELVRYFVARRLGGVVGLPRRVVVIDARRRRVEKHLGVGRDVASYVEELVASAAGLPRGLVGLLEELVSRLMRPAIILIDEFHLLLRDRLEALAELEALAGFLAKRGEERTRLVVTVSEGFFATLDAVHRLLGYSAGYLLVEPMDQVSFAALYEEYRARHSCSVDLDLFTRLAGTSPGYLVDLCPRRGRLLEDWVQAELERLTAAIEEAAEAVGAGPAEAARRAARLLRGEPPASPLERRLGEKLVEVNVAYPCRVGARRVYLPQLPLYRVALEAGIVPGGAVEPGRALRLIAEYEGPALRRCAELERGGSRATR